MSSTEPLCFAVLGDPVAHSMSPVMHRAAFSALGLPHRYEARRVPRDALASALAELEADGFRGVNLTVPHKAQGARILRAAGAPLHGAASRVDAVNTVVWGDGGPAGHATDGWGFMRAVEELVTGPLGHATVLGGGGAARCIVDALVHSRHGAPRVSWVSRDPESLVAPAGVEVCGWSGFCPRGQILVNATSVGMKGGPTEFPLPIDFSSLDEGAVVVDIVYPRPLGGLLDQAQALGFSVGDGRAMLLWQGVKALEIWLEEPIGAEIVDVMRRSIGLVSP